MTSYQALGLTPIIHASGAVTRLGGAPMPTEVLDAFRDGAAGWVPLEHLQAAAGRRIAELTGPEMGVLIITHHERLLEFNRPDYAHVMLAGRIVETGDADLAHELHANGYATIRQRHPEAAAEEQEQEAQQVASTT